MRALGGLDGEPAQEAAEALAEAVVRPALQPRHRGQHARGRVVSHELGRAHLHSDVRYVLLVLFLYLE